MPNEERLDLTVDVMVHVEEQYEGKVNLTLLRELAYIVLAGEGVRGAVEVGARITSDHGVHSLNLDFRGIDAPTDVLSFSAEETQGELDPFVLPPEEEEQDQARYLGDLAISYDRVVSQAAEYGHSRRRELCYLFTHGLLHLLGYDHQDEAGASEMRDHEERYLGELGLTRENEPPEAAGR